MNNKLRLIKPWGLRTVRQHLNVVNEDRASAMFIQQCMGPVATDAICRFEPMDIRSGRHVDDRSQHRVKAPVAVCLQLRFAAVCLR